MLTIENTFVGRIRSSCGHGTQTINQISKCISGANHQFFVMIVYLILKCGDHGLVSLCDWPSPGLDEQRVCVGQ